MGIQTEVCELLDIEYPILQGALGPNGTVELAAAVSNAGGLGTISTGGTSISPNQARAHMEDHLERITENTDNPFAANSPVGSLDMAIKNVKVYDRYIGTALRMKREHPAVSEQLRLLITSGGNPERLIDEINTVKNDTDLLHFHKVGRVKHAVKAEELGVDGVIAAGFEMGAHTHQPDGAVHTFVLVPQVAQAVDIPVIAAGGVKDGHSLLGALALGAKGVSMGTRFLTTAESEFADNYKEYIIDADEGSDRVIGTGRPVRALDSPTLDEYREQIKELGMDEFTELEEEKALSAQLGGNTEEGVVWSGQIGCYIDSIQTVDELIDGMVREAETVFDDLSNAVIGL